MGRFFNRDAVEGSVDLRTDTRPTWGRPTRCPACGGKGYLDHVDLVAGVMHQHCPDCWHEWKTPETETGPV